MTAACRDLGVFCLFYPHFSVIGSSINIVGWLVWFCFFLLLLFLFLVVAMAISKLIPKQKSPRIIQKVFTRLGKPTNDAKAAMS